MSTSASWKAMVLAAYTRSIRCRPYSGTWWETRWRRAKSNTRVKYSWSRRSSWFRIHSYKTSLIAILRLTAKSRWSGNSFLSRARTITYMNHTDRLLTISSTSGLDRVGTGIIRSQLPNWWKFGSIQVPVYLSLQEETSLGIEISIITCKSSLKSKVHYGIKTGMQSLPR